jgi:hypothetical protein
VTRAPLLALCLAAATPSPGLQIVFTDIGPDIGRGAMSAEALGGFQAAAALWESLLADPVVVRINIAAYDFGPGLSNVIGQAGSTLYTGDYTEFRDALLADRSSRVDDAVLATLPAGTTYTRLINLSPDLADPTSPTLSTSDQFWINGANAKALGLLPPDFAEVDAFIEFNTAFAFDFDRADGIAANRMDFIGVAAHEIGHALGFISIADYVDMAEFPSTLLHNMPMDFLRYSPPSYQLGLTDVSVEDDLRFLAIGQLGILMSTGVTHGDGQQASHFLDNAGLGMMDPTAALGDLRLLTGYDLVVFDAIGWDLTPEALALAREAFAAVPEPSTLGLGLGGLGLALATRRRRRSR